MAKRKTAEALRRIVSVRHIQQKAAEQRLASAAQRVGERQQISHDAEAALTMDLAGWRRQHSEGLDVGITAAWSAVVLRSDADLSKADAALEESKTARNTCEADLRLAIGRSETAELLSEAAEKRDRRRREEAALSEIAEMRR